MYRRPRRRIASPTGYRGVPAAQQSDPHGRIDHEPHPGNGSSNTPKIEDDTFCLLPLVFCLLPLVFCLLPLVFCLVPHASPMTSSMKKARCRALIFAPALVGCPPPT